MEHRYNLNALARMAMRALAIDAPDLVLVDCEIFFDSATQELVVREYVPPPEPAGKTVVLATEARLGAQP